MLPFADAPCFYGKGESFTGYTQQVELRRQVDKLGPANRDPALISQMGAVAQEVYMAAGSDAIMDPGGDQEDSGIVARLLRAGGRGLG